MKKTITSVVAHIDHGKTSLIDSLVASQGRISRTLAGVLRFLDTRDDEQIRGITLKLSAISLERHGNGYVFIDTPGHVDFESLIQTSSILSDGFLILIDINEGITPRTYSLVKYTKNKGCVLVINKIDKVISSDKLFLKISSIITSMNGLIGEDMFSWNNNNVILCCATLCYGVNKRMFRNVVGKEGTLRDAINFIFHLYTRIDDGEIEGICSRFNISSRNKKNILSTVLPLSDCVFDSVDGIEAMKDPSVKEVDIDDERLFKYMESFLRCDLIRLRAIDPIQIPSLIGITTYGMLKDHGRYSKDSILFVTRLFHGTIKRGDVVYSVDNKKIVESRVNNLYSFGINELIEEDELGPGLICMSGEFQRNSLITDVPTCWIDIESKITPFYKSKVVLEDIDQVDDLKEVFRVMSCTEQFLKVRLNRYGEMEMFCTGKVQFEKITTDLTELGFKYLISDFEDRFCEYVTTSSSDEFKLDGLTLRIEISRIDEGIDSDDIKRPDQNRNQFVLPSDVCSDVISSVLETFVSNGPLVRENMYETRIVCDLQGEIGTTSSDTLYSFIRNSLTSVYLRCSPTVAPSFYECFISIQEKLIGETYKSLSKYHCIIKGEDYEDKTGFHIITVLIPQFLYPSFLEDIRVKTRGTGYLSLKEAGYVCGLDFNEHINEIRKKKGLFIDEKIVEEPSKQRTYKK